MLTKRLLTVAAALALGVHLPYPVPDAATVRGAAYAAPAAPAEDPEVKMGREAHEDLKKSGIKLITDPKIVGRVETIGKKLATIANDTEFPATYGSDRVAKFDYKFFVVDDKDVNAFSLPGGFIYVNKGLLDYVQSDDELAGVLGHEIIHAAHHHVVQLQKKQGQLNMQVALALIAMLVTKAPTADTYNVMQGLQLLAVQQVSGHSQNAERDADYAGVMVARKGGYNPVGALTFMERLQRDEKTRPDVELGIFRTHPPSNERAEAMIAQITKLGLPINRRAVTRSLIASTRAATGTDAGTELMVAGKVLYRSRSAERVKKAETVLNELLDRDLQIHDLRKSGPTLLGKGEVILTADADDAAVSKLATPDEVAQQALDVLKNAIFDYKLLGGGH